MKAALVTLQKKLRGYDAQNAELLQLQDNLHSKVVSKLYNTFASIRILFTNCLPGQVRAAKSQLKEHQAQLEERASQVARYEAQQHEQALHIR